MLILAGVGLRGLRLVTSRNKGAERLPVLIIQGRDDPYGNAEDLRDIPLSEHVEWHLTDGGHEFLIGETGWQTVGRRVLLFLARVAEEARIAQADTTAAAAN